MHASYSGGELFWRASEPDHVVAQLGETQSGFGSKVAAPGNQHSHATSFAALTYPKAVTKFPVSIQPAFNLRP